MPENMMPAFVAYNISEIDTLIIKRFAKGSNFSQQVDSALVTAQRTSYITSGDTTRVIAEILQQVSDDYDWQLTNPFDNRTVRVSDIVHERREQHCGGIFGMDPQACTSPVTSFKLNGVTTVPDPNFLYRAIFIKK